MKTRTADPWIPADRYGRLLPGFMANLIVRNVPRAVTFYQDVLGGVIHYRNETREALSSWAQAMGATATAGGGIAGIAARPCRGERSW